uniref:Uncharacterized protein n=1 Tax=Gasterosteus aculeatus TaxID=69293 RepID=G3N514_GASAC
MARYSNLKAYILALSALDICEQTFEHGPQGEVCRFRSRNNGKAGLAAVVPKPVTGHNAVLCIILILKFVDNHLVQTLVADESVFFVIFSRDELLSGFVPDDTRFRVNGDGYAKAHILTNVGCAIDQRKGELRWLLKHSGSVDSALC